MHKKSMQVIKIRGGHTASKRCVISLGVGKEVYKKCLDRLAESLVRTGFAGDLLTWSDHYPEGCPEFLDAPFAFKTYCFFAAKELGYEQILWMDPPCVALRPLDGIYHQMQKNGYILFNNNYGQMMGQWCGDATLSANHITREQALQIPEIPCSVLGLDMRSERAVAFLQAWSSIMRDGVSAKGTSRTIEDWEDYQAVFWNTGARISTDPRVKGHRCDQPAAGIVAHRLGMQPYGDELRDFHYKAKPIKRNTVILHHREFGTSIKSLDQIYHEVFFRIPFVETPLSKLRNLKRRLKSLSSTLEQ